MHAIPRATAWLVVLVAAMTILGCARTPPEQQLRESVTSLQASVQTRDASGLEDRLVGGLARRPVTTRFR